MKQPNSDIGCIAPCPQPATPLGTYTYTKLKRDTHLHTNQGGRGTMTPPISEIFQIFYNNMQFSGYAGENFAQMGVSAPSKHQPNTNSGYVWHQPGKHAHLYIYLEAV